MSQDPFTIRLLIWHESIARNLPWKEHNDPYKIWLSEIILQQTRVEQGLPYYLKFTEAYPDVFTLAEASEDQVLKLWEGLGYYSRARNLHYTARHVVKEMDGVFPDTYEGLLKLKGVGPYTAAAIASFANGLPHAVVDGNVIRVISRYVGIIDPVDELATKKDISRIAHQYLDQKNPGSFNQAIMDFGALQCVPKSPDCTQCPLQESCYAYANEMVDMLPYKKKTVAKKAISMNYYILFDESHILIKKRIGNSIWKGLHDFITLSPGYNSVESAIMESVPDGLINLRHHVKDLGPYLHILTHRRITAYFHLYKVEFRNKGSKVKAPYYLVDRKKLSNFAFPMLIKKHVLDEGLLNVEN
ncbi:MAG: A/G-specific adenine glycosylase [Saprospiraceae bacterium]|nr:A/G-specific adenine glycosylase [Saprospiraceae bacterium]